MAEVMCSPNRPVPPIMRIFWEADMIGVGGCRCGIGFGQENEIGLRRCRAMLALVNHVILVCSPEIQPLQWRKCCSCRCRGYRREGRWHQDTQPISDVSQERLLVLQLHTMAALCIPAPFVPSRRSHRIVTERH